MWIKLLTFYQVEINGELKRYQPGDWCDLGKQEAMRLVNSNAAEIPNYVKVIRELMGGSGIAVLDAEMLKTYEEGAKQIGVEIRIIERPRCAFERTILLTGPSAIRSESFATGLGLLDKWEVVCPLLSYETLAVHTSTAEDRELTKKIISDLRVPLYDIRCIFLKRCENSERLMAEWELQNVGGDPALAFLRALYIVKPFILALPVTWMDTSYDNKVAE